MTLSFSALNDVQNDIFEEGTTNHQRDSPLPVFYRSHMPYYALMERFKWYIYIYRNPLDCLISNYHWRKNRTVPFGQYPPHERKNMHNLDFFVMRTLHNWVFHYKISSAHSTHLLSYESMKEDAFAVFHPVLKDLEGTVDALVLRKSIQLSSQENVKKMAAQQNQEAGMGDASFKGKFIRDGSMKQYKTVLNAATIRKTQKILNLYGVPITL